MLNAPATVGRARSNSILFAPAPALAPGQDAVETVPIRFPRALSNSTAAAAATAAADCDSDHTRAPSPVLPAIENASPAMQRFRSRRGSFLPVNAKPITLSYTPTAPRSPAAPSPTSSTTSTSTTSPSSTYSPPATSAYNRIQAQMKQRLTGGGGGSLGLGSSRLGLQSPAFPGMLGRPQSRGYYSTRPGSRLGSPGMRLGSPGSRSRPGSPLPLADLLQGSRKRRLPVSPAAERFFRQTSRHYLHGKALEADEADDADFGGPAVAASALGTPSTSSGSAAAAAGSTSTSPAVITAARLEQVRECCATPSFCRSAAEAKVIWRYLRQTPAIRAFFTDAVLFQLAETGLHEEYPSDGFDLVVKGAFYVVLRGSVFVRAADGSESVLGPGQVFGSMPKLCANITVASTHEECDLIRFAMGEHQRIVRQIEDDEFEEKHRVISQFEVFKDWPTLSMRRLTKKLEWRHVRAGETLVDEGQVAPYLGFIHQGSCVALRRFDPVLEPSLARRTAKIESCPRSELVRAARAAAHPNHQPVILRSTISPQDREGVLVEIGSLGPGAYFGEHSMLVPIMANAGKLAFDGTPVECCSLVAQTDMMILALPAACASDVEVVMAMSLLESPARRDFSTVSADAVQAQYNRLVRQECWMTYKADIVRDRRVRGAQDAHTTLKL